MRGGNRRKVFERKWTEREVTVKNSILKREVGGVLPKGIVKGRDRTRIRGQFQGSLRKSMTPDLHFRRSKFKVTSKLEGNPIIKCNFVTFIALFNSLSEN